MFFTLKKLKDTGAYTWVEGEGVKVCSAPPPTMWFTLKKLKETGAYTWVEGGRLKCAVSHPNMWSTLKKEKQKLNNVSP